MVHDAKYREALEQRVRSLRAASRREWGEMSVDQMLWHVNTLPTIAVAARHRRFHGHRCRGLS